MELLRDLEKEGKLILSLLSCLHVAIGCAVLANSSSYAIVHLTSFDSTSTAGTRTGFISAGPALWNDSLELEPSRGAGH